MSKNIPTYQLNMLADSDRDSAGFFFLSQNLERPKVRIDIPYRSNYYKIGVCLRGCAEVKVDLETYNIEPNCLMIMSPHIIKQWTKISGDFDALDIFFTEEFITTGNNLNLNKFRFFEKDAQHALQISPAQAENIAASVKFIQQKYDAHQTYRDDILQNLVISLLYEMASIYEQQTAASGSAQTRSGFLATEFKKLVNIHFSAERNLKFYADKLSITPKHLTETVKEATGRTAGEWIAEAVVLEAKVLLQSPALNIAQISEMFHFPDQSTFGKFFKNQTGHSPAAYKQTL